MIKIVKSNKIKEMSCIYCGCVFTFEEEDVEINFHNCAYVVCPECNCYCIIK